MTPLQHAMSEIITVESRLARLEHRRDQIQERLVARYVARGASPEVAREAVRKSTEAAAHGHGPRALVRAVALLKEAGHERGEAQDHWRQHRDASAGAA